MIALLPISQTMPRPGAAVTFDQMVAAEVAIAEALPEMMDIGEIEDTRDRLRAVEQYLRGKQMHLPALGAQRRLEARIGQLLGEAEHGGDRKSGRFKSGTADLIAKDDRVEFRVLARALAGECELTADEWRQSRRALVEIIKERTSKEEPMAEPKVVVPPHHQIHIPAGMSAEELTRKGMAREADGGVTTKDIAADFGIGIASYRKMRDIVMIADRAERLSPKDAAAAKQALRLLNGTNSTVLACELVTPIALRIWGSGVNAGASRESVENLRADRFDHAFNLVLQACETSVDFDVPYLSAERQAEALAQVDAAVRNLAVLRRHVAEARG